MISVVKSHLLSVIEDFYRSNPKNQDKFKLKRASFPSLFFFLFLFDQMIRVFLKIKLKKIFGSNFELTIKVN
jgi:hypothetical protein